MRKKKHRRLTYSRCLSVSIISVPCTCLFLKQSFWLTAWLTNWLGKNVTKSDRLTTISVCIVNSFTALNESSRLHCKQHTRPLRLMCNIAALLHCISRTAYLQYCISLVHTIICLSWTAIKKNTETTKRNQIRKYMRDLYCRNVYRKISNYDKKRKRCTFSFKGLNICYRHNFCRWLQPGYNHDSTAIRLRFDYDSITIRLRFDCDSDSIGLRFDYDSIALRPFDDLRKPTCVCGLLRYGLNK